MELFDIYDIDKIKTGRTAVRGEKIEKGDYRMVVHACIFSADGRMLIQKRQPSKEVWPDMWDVTVGGSAVSGDTSRMAVERELFEELGLKFDFSETCPHLTVNFDRGFDDFYLIEWDVDITRLVLQHEEVQAVRWASADEIHQMIDKGEFIPYHKNLVSLLFDMRKYYGSAHRKENN